MDDTNTSRATDASAAATRKRRSSILKSQRPLRTPFSELEFNVATPTDTAKSRRVSFSKRTGVAEFATNEATTTWKNVYEEQNKSMESSGNESEMNAPRTVVSLGKRIFDQQFEEVEAIDLLTTMNNRSGLNINHSIQNLNFAPLEMTAGALDKLTAPQNKFELSTLTDKQSKVFTDDLSLATMEVTEGINVNFSNIQALSEKDDLDAIEKDIGRVQSNVICHGPLNVRDMSGYIEVDLNTTNVVIRMEESDMSITDSVHVSKVEDLSRSISSDKKEFNKDWVVDKENIAINPYIAPKESCNFAINEESDKVLVFDGKRLTIQSEKDNLKANRHTMLPNAVQNKDQRKTITLNLNDDLPNFFTETEALTNDTYQVASAKSVDDVNITNINENKLHTLIFADSMDISMTQALPTNIAVNEIVREEKLENTLFRKDTGNMSFTQAVPGPIIVYENDAETSLVQMEKKANKCNSQEKNDDNAQVSSIVETHKQNKRNTILYESNNDISITQAVGGNILLLNSKERRQTILFDNGGNMSMTQAIPTNVLSKEQIQKQKSNASDNSNLQLDNNLHNPSKINKRRTIIFDNDAGDISVTQALPTNILTSNIRSENMCDEIDQTNSKGLTIYDENINDMSVTEALPGNVILDMKPNSSCNISTTKCVDKPVGELVKTETQRHNCDKENDDLLLTSTFPCDNKLPSNETNKTVIQDKCEKRKTIHYEHDNGDISITQAIPTNIFVNDNHLNIEKSDGYESKILDIQTHNFKNTDISMTKENRSNLSKHIFDVFVTDTTSCVPNLNQSRKGNCEIELRAAEEIDNLPMRITDRSYAEHNIVVNKSFQKLNNLTTNLIDTAGTNSNPAVELLEAQNELNKSNRSKLDMETMHQNVLLYQSFTTTVSQPTIQGIEQGDVKDNGIFDVCDEKPESSTTVIDENKIDVDDQLSNVEKDCISENIIPTTTFSKESADIEMVDTDKPVSVLDELLDMSTDSVEGVLDDQCCTAKVETTHFSTESVKNPDEDKASDESMFYITRDIDVEAQTDFLSKSVTVNNTSKIETSHLPLESKEDETSIVHSVRNKLANLKTVLKSSKKSPPQNRLYEKILSSDVTLRGENDKVQDRLSIAGKSFKTADDTRDLLKLISDFTDKKVSDYIEEEEQETETVLVKGNIDIDDKKTEEPKRLSFAPNRQSIVISREDLLNNISMAQAALQKSRYEFDESDSINDTKEESLDESFHKKSVRMSSEVVKTLHFDDETVSESSIKSEFNASPLKKTAFGETSYMKETKANVIPSYLKDVSDNIKELMSDLVKPIHDVMPFEAENSDKGIRNSNSTCSTQVQANLITSSQIDIESDMNSEYQTPLGMEVDGLKDSIANLGNRAVEHALKSALKCPRMTEIYSDVDVVSADDSFKELRTVRPSGERDVAGKVLIFDHNNPLNNVLLEPPDKVEVHRYNPQKSSETVSLSKSDSAQISLHDIEKDRNVERISTQYLVETGNFLKQGGDMVSETATDILCNPSNISKPMSIDESIDVKPIDVKDIQVNTVIAMKGTKELLEASSSLTLVDDALTNPMFDIKIDTENTSKDVVSSKIQLSPVKTINNEVGDNFPKIESALTSIDGKTEIRAKTKKRVYNSPANLEKQKSHAPYLELNQKPLSKMQKISGSPVSMRNKELNPETDHDVEPSTTVQKLFTESQSDTKDVKSESTIPSSASTCDTEEKPSRGSKIDRNLSRNKQERNSALNNKKTGTSVVVQALLAEYDHKSNNDKSECTSPIAVSISDGDERSVGKISSFTSSKNMYEFNQRSVTNTVSFTTSTVSKGSKNSGNDWHEEDGSKYPSSDCEMGVNVVAKIDMLPFMGTQDCEWESWSSDTWTYRLLHSQLRLVVRLAHRHDNATRTRVSADTPVLAISVHTALHDKRNSVGVVCVGFAAETMRYFAGSTCSVAGDVPALLKKCCAVARLALKWGRAMHDARMHLAYTLTENGILALKVANIGLRSVWEVKMRLELVVEEAKEAPWPQATDVRVSRVVSDYKVTDSEVEWALRHIPRDWGHVPKTVWRIFKYLKHKTADGFLDEC